MLCIALFQSPRTRAPGYNTGSLLALDYIKCSSTNPQHWSSTTSALNHGPGGPERKIWAQNEMKLVKWTRELAQGLASCATGHKSIRSLGRCHNSHVGWSNSYDQSGYLESRHNVPEKGNRKCCVYKVPRDQVLIIAILVIFSAGSELHYIPNVFLVTSTTDI